jgi:limonene-1,2-epoxide hydrolase
MMALLPEDVVKAAVSNEWSGKKVMALLLDRLGDQIQITEDVVKAAAGNSSVLTELLDRQARKRQH